MRGKLKLASFADQFPAHMKERVEELASKLEKETADKLDALIELPARTGALRASKQLKSSQAGMRLGWTAVHAIPIDMGRRRSKQYRRTLPSGKKTRPFSRLLGSDRLPEGFTAPALRLLREGWDEIVQDVDKAI
jgi:hypothetical protein